MTRPKRSSWQRWRGCCRACQSYPKRRFITFRPSRSKATSYSSIRLTEPVNWSLVGYHFRGKHGLLAEIYRRHCTTLNHERIRLLAEARAAGLQLESVIEAFVRPALAEIQDGDGQNQFSRLRAMLAAEDAPLFAQLVADNFDQSSRTFVAALRACLPELPPDEVLWRFHFMLGTIYYSASSPQRIKAFSRGRCDPGDLEATLRHLVPFLAAAFRSAPVTTTRSRRRAGASKKKPR